MTLIGITGYAQAGKDTLADFLVARFGFVKLSFADGVREMAEEINPIVFDHQGGVYERYNEAVFIHGYEGAKNNTTLRDVLVGIGRGARNVLGENVWIDRVEKRMVEDRYNRNFVISDVRYPNEAEMVSNNGGLVWEVIRPGVEAANDEEYCSIADIDPDLVLMNSGSVHDLTGLIELPEETLPGGIQAAWDALVKDDRHDRRWDVI